MRIHLPFKPEMQKAIRDGYKHYTTRTRPYGKPGDYFFVRGIKYELMSVEKTKLRDVIYNYYSVEGFNNPTEFMYYWGKLHPRAGVIMDQDVWLHRFRRVWDSETGHTTF